MLPQNHGETTIQKMPVERDGNSKALGLSTRFCSHSRVFGPSYCLCERSPVQVTSRKCHYTCFLGFRTPRSRVMSAADHHRSGSSVLKKETVWYSNLQKIEKYIITLLAGIYQFLSFLGDAYRMGQIFSLHIAIAPLVNGRPGLL